MCSADKKIERLEIGMSDVRTDIAVLNTKMDGIITAIKDMKEDREQEIKNIISALQQQIKEQKQEEKDCNKTVDNRKWQVGFWLVTLILGWVLLEKVFPMF